MEDESKTGWGKRIVKGFQKSWAWLAAVAGLVVTVVPDLAAAALANIGIWTTAFPKMGVETKFTILTVALIAVVVLRPLRQPRWMRPDDSIPVAIIRVPETVAIGAKIVATEVESHERTK